MSSQEVRTARWSALTTRVLAPNPGLMTLDGTNTFVIRAEEGAPAVVVDPGPDVPEHLDRLEQLGPIGLILLTHHHQDHVEAVDALVVRTGAPVRAVDPALCAGAPSLRDGEVIDAGGTRITVISTPGHTADSVCFHLPEDRALDARESSGSLLTGDTILGRGTTILARPDGSLADYLRSLTRLDALSDAGQVLPGHGPALSSLKAVVATYLQHRQERLAQITAALEALNLPARTDDDVVAQVTDYVYPRVHERLRFAAEASTYAQLEYLAATA